MNTTTVASGKAWGYIKQDGDTAIPFVFEHATPFSEGLGAVAVQRQYGWINPLGEWVIPPKYESPGWFITNRATIVLEGKCGVIDNSGQIVISPTFDFIDDFSEGMARLSINGKYGFIDTCGTIVVSVQFLSAESFSGGFATVSSWANPEEHFYLSRSGEIAFGPFLGAERFSEGWAAVYDHHGCRFISSSGDTVLELPPNIFPYYFSEGLAAAQLQSGSCVSKGFLDRQGQWAIPPRFDSVSPFKNGSALVEFGDERALIRPNGSYLVPPGYRALEGCEENRILYAETDDWGYLDENGAPAIPAHFYAAHQFAGGTAAVCVLQSPGAE